MRERERDRRAGSPDIPLAAAAMIADRTIGCSRGEKRALERSFMNGW